MATYNEKDVADAVSELTHGCDGPVTAFVLLHRAAEEAARGMDPKLVADALYEALVAYEYMPDHEAARTDAPAINTADGAPR